MSSDFKGLVKSCKVRGNEKAAISCVQSRTQEAEATDLEGWWMVLTGKKGKKELSYCHYSIFALLRRTFSVEIVDQAMNRQEGFEGQAITWHASNTSKPYVLHQFNDTVNSFRCSENSRKHEWMIEDQLRT
jgi:hypothetical protein